MYFQKQKIYENNALGSGDSGDLPTTRLPQNRAISSLMLTIRNKNGATSNTDDAGALETIVNSIEEIKIQVGNHIIKEYSGQACRDWATYRNGRMPFFRNTQAAGGSYPAGWQEAVFPIDFGRFPGDPICGLPAPLFESLDMYVKYDFNVDAADGFVTGSHKFDLYANVFPQMSREALGNLRVIEQRKKQDHTTVASGIEPIDLTIDPVRQLRQVMVRCYQTGIAEGVDITKVALEVDSATTHTDDWNRWQWQNAMDSQLKYLQNIQSVYLDDSSHVLYCEIPNVEPQVSALATTTEDVYLSTTGDQITVAGADGTDAVALALHSQVIPCCVFIDLDKDRSMRNMIPQNVKDLDIKLTQGGAAGGAVEVHEMSVVPASVFMNI